MDNELITEKTWWKRNWKWLVPLSVFMLLCLLLLITLLNNIDKGPAQQSRFDSQKWKAINGSDYPHRDGMLKNLMDSDTLRMLEKNEVIALLGPPDRIDNDYLFYTVAQKRAGFFPLHTKTLVVKLGQNGEKNAILVHK